MIRISGNTFPYKELLKQIGAKWDGAERLWTIHTGADVSSLHSLPGLVITGDVKPIDTPTPRPERKPFDFEKFFSDIEQKRPKLIGSGSPAIHGNDETYLNAFSAKNPPMFAGFRSLPDLIDFVEAIPEHVSRDNNDGRNTGWDRNRGSWFGTGSMWQAIDLARNGWSKGTELATEASEIISGEHAVRRMRDYNVAGGRVNIGRLLSGHPLHMQHRSKRDGKKVVTLFVQTFMSAGIDTENAIIRAASVAAMSDVLATNGYSCEIVAVCTPAARSGRPGGHIATVVKEAGEPLNIENVVFALGHPSMFRRLYFGVYANEERLRSFWSYMGSPANAFDDPEDLPPGSLYVRKLDLDHQRQVEGNTFKDRVRSLFPLIVPDGFPVELS